MELLILALLQVKHWYIDFVDQSMDEVNNKGHYGKWLGIRHSLKHAGATFIIFLMFVSSWMALVIAIIDLVIHYHTDWAKMNYGNRDMYDPAFWNHLGLDQMVHQLTYILLILLIV
jgi:hypothetical protein